MANSLGQDHAAGLLARLSQPGNARADAVELAASIAANAPLAVRVTKAIVADSHGWPDTESFDRQREISEPQGCRNSGGSLIHG